MLTTESIPVELRERAQWVLWRYETNDKGQRTKVLYQTKCPERKASTTSPRTWADFASTLVSVTENQGVGFVFTLDDPYVGIDLDGCIKNGTIEPWAEQLMLQFPGYAEYSPSGNGVHLIGKGTLSKGWNQKPIEAYDRGRYFTFTGNVVPGRPTTINTWSRLEDLELCIEYAAKALRECPVFPALFSGDWQANKYPSQSEGDVGFVADLLRSGATTLEQIKAAVSISGLWRKEKWLDRDDYAESTFKSAATLIRANNPEVSRATMKTDDGSLARHLAEMLRDTLAYDAVGKVWRMFNTCVWPVADDLSVYDIVETALYELLRESSARQVHSILGMLKAKMVRSFDSTPGLPMSTQVLDVVIKETRPYTADDAFTWQLPFDYVPEAECPTIERWLDGSTEKRQTLLAFARALLLGYQDGEVYIEAVGPGGVGKSTYTNLLQALVGTENTVASSFARLKANKRFETAGFYGKRLLVFPDEKAFVEEVDLFKKLTSASDLIPAELKGVNGTFNFRFQGLVVVTSNTVLVSSDKSAGLARRRLIVHFHKAPGAWPRLLDFKNGKAIGTFVAELPGFLNLLLEMSTEAMVDALKPLNETYRQALTETDTLAAWCQDTLTYAPEEGLYHLR